LEAIARGIGTEPGDLPDGPQLAALLDASAGLTRMEAEGAYSLSLVRHGRIRPEEVWDLNPDFRGRENNQGFWGRKPRFLRDLAISALGSLIVYPARIDTIGIKSTLAFL
jgi:hypothetical protein